MDNEIGLASCPREYNDIDVPVMKQVEVPHITTIENIVEVLHVQVVEKIVEFPMAG